MNDTAMPYFSSDTIAQIGTPPGQARVGALRLSGGAAWEVLDRTTRGLADALTRPERSVLSCRFEVALATRGKAGRARERFGCPARVFLMPAPASYTRENVAEIHLPGSPALLGAALATLIAAGARAAAPGEFTFRAFRNGRLSLGQAEAVEDVIRAGTDGERRQALSRLGDAGRAAIRKWRDRLMDMAASLEAALDFSEEELENDAAAGLAHMAAELAALGTGMAASGRDVASELPHIALVGLSNAGKSSLLNALLGEETVLVSGQASTTRDSLRREVAWGGARMVISDNPGYDPGGAGSGGRAAARAFERLGGEDLACWVIDSSRPLGADDAAFAAALTGAAMLVLNKRDLPPVVSTEDALALAARAGVSIVRCVEASTVSGEGLPALRRCLGRTAAKLLSAGPWNHREVLELSVAGECCRQAADELAGPARLELAAEDVRRGVAAFSRALGEGYAEEALGRIFSRFCIGK